MPDKTDQVRALRFHADRRVDDIQVARQGKTLMTEPDYSGLRQGYQITEPLRRLEKGQPYVLLRSDRLEPVTRPGIPDTRVSIGDRRAAFTLAYTAVSSGVHMANDAVITALQRQRFVTWLLFGAIAIAVVLMIVATGTTVMDYLPVGEEADAVTSAEAEATEETTQ